MIELIKKFNDDLELDPKAFEDNDSGFEDIMSYNDILNYVEREYSNEDGHIWHKNNWPLFEIRKERRGGQD